MFANRNPVCHGVQPTGKLPIPAQRTLKMDWAHDMPTALTQTHVASFDERLGRQLYLLGVAIHQTKGRLPLYLFAGSIVLVIVATAAMQVKLNAWNSPFYDAIEHKDFDAFLQQLVVFFGIAGILLVLNVCQTGLNQMFRLKLRELATKDLIGTWMTQKRASRISRAGQIGVNPDQRIHEDVHHLTDLTTDLGVGLVQSSLLLASFIGVLWVLSRGIVLHFGDREFDIPGYMVWAALIYALSGSWLCWLVGRPLVRLQTSRYALEANLRFALVQGAEQADGVALSNGEADERRVLERELESLLVVLKRIVFATVRLTGMTAGYGWVALVFPIVVAAPGYFSGKLTFGELMMVVGAFNQVQQSLRWFVDNTGAIADWRATMLRVMNFREALIELDRFEAGCERIERAHTPEDRLSLEGLAIMSFRGRTELSEPRVDIHPGERVVFVGKPGTGKSTLLLSIAGLWSWGSGRIGLPPSDNMMFLSQRPFVPAGSIRTALTYANNHRQPPSDVELTAVLERVGLGQLSHSLDQVQRWDKELSIGEQRRLTFARLLLRRPKWVISDEALDLLDDASREIILSIFATELAESAVISIAGTASSSNFYTRTIQLVAHRPEKAWYPGKDRRSAPVDPGGQITVA